MRKTLARHAVDQLQPHFFSTGARALAFAVALIGYPYILECVRGARLAPTHAIMEGLGAGH